MNKCNWNNPCSHCDKDKVCHYDQYCAMKSNN